MWTITALRAHPHFAPLFAHVHALCWPILWWQLNRLIRWFQAAGSPNVLYSVSRWGFVSVRVIGDRKDPAAYTPVPRTFRPLTDPSWGSDLPACLEVPILGAAACTLILPCEAGVRPAIFTANTS